MVFFGAEQVIGLLGLLVLIPFIIVYLIKPRPVKLAVPSLMFFMKKTKISVQDSLFRIFQKDYLFFIQLFILLLLAFSLAYPYFAKSEDVVSRNIVFVLDASGSMHTIEGGLGGKTRFVIAKDEIKKLASDSNTLILVKSYPVIAVKNAGKSEFLAFLNRLQPTDGESRIGDAILMAGETIDSGKDKTGKVNGRVIVLSDFINTKGVSVKTAQDILLGKEINIDLINVGEGKHENLGIVNIVADEESASVFIKNYGLSNVNVKLDVDGQNESLNIKAGDSEPFIYKTKEGVSKIEILNKDDFLSDNVGYIANPAGKKINVMLITNSPIKFLTAAINSSSRIRLKVVEPPVIPKDDKDFKTDVYILGKIDYTKIIAGTFEDLLKKVKDDGASVIITSQDGINNVDFKGLNNIGFVTGFNLANTTTKTEAITLNIITKFTKDIDFGAVKKAYNVLDVKGDVIAESNNVPLIVYSEIGNGKIVYYGILEKESSFHLSPDYPVFWSSLIKDLTGAREMNELNLKTGMSFIDEKNNEIVVDSIGIYNISSNQIAVNMNSLSESDINFVDINEGADSGNSKGLVIGEKISGYNFKTIKEDVKTSLIDYLIVVGMILIIFEIYYIKNRGEL